LKAAIVEIHLPLNKGDISSQKNITGCPTLFHDILLVLQLKTEAGIDLDTSISWKIAQLLQFCMLNPTMVI
jgi:hypothetical protein